MELGRMLRFLLAVTMVAPLSLVIVGCGSAKVTQVPPESKADPDPAKKPGAGGPAPTKGGPAKQ